MARTAEDVVRDYLRYLADPDSVSADTADLDARIEATDDPLERVKLRSERARRQDVGPRLEAEFVAEVAGWAREHDVTPEALLEEGVERRVLVEAGLLSGASRTTRRTTSRAPSGGSGGGRTSRETIDRYVRGLRAGTTFTTATVVNDAGGSVATVRKVLDALQAEGVITEDGKDHSGPGRPRTQFRRT